MTTGTGSRCRVLLVEDEALVAMLMEDMLADLDCEIFAAVGRLDEAVAAARTGQFDMAFIDVNLRGVPAWPLADVLRSRAIPFAFVTGYGMAGADPAYADIPVLQKPFRGQDLEAVLQRLRRLKRGLGPDR
jgi:CheY-like chemotaxis protein